MVCGVRTQVRRCWRRYEKIHGNCLTAFRGSVRGATTPISCGSRPATSVTRRSIFGRRGPVWTRCRATTKQLPPANPRRKAFSAGCQRARRVPTFRLRFGRTEENESGVFQTGLHSCLTNVRLK
jgi:hypothetical protein